MLRLFLALSLVSLLAGCWGPTPTIDVEQAQGGTLTIRVSGRDPNTQYCVQGLGIGEPDPPPGRVIWSIGQTSHYRDVCRSTFTYPEVPAGFEVFAPEEQAELVEGRSYLVEAGGPGFHAETTFVRETQEY